MSADVMTTYAHECRGLHVAIGFDGDSCPLCGVQIIIRDYVRDRASCLCCDATLECDPECTFANDCPLEHARMMEARELLRDVAACVAGGDS